MGNQNFSYKLVFGYTKRSAQEGLAADFGMRHADKSNHLPSEMNDLL